MNAPASKSSDFSNYLVNLAGPLTLALAPTGPAANRSSNRLHGNECGL